MSTAVATITDTATTCERCGDTVLRRFTTGQRPIVLDAEPLAGGIYHLDRHGRAERRHLTVLYAEARAGVRQPGYEPHECTAPRDQPWYQRD